MAATFYNDAQLTAAKTYIEDPLSNPLNTADLPHTERAWYGDPEPGIKIKDGTNPGVDNVMIPILHLVPERANNEAVLANDERRSETHNTYVYKAQGAGNTAPAPPIWPTTIGATVVDGAVTWECVRRTTEPEVMKLALTQPGLATATPGAPLDFGVTEVLSLAINAVEVWIEVDGIPALVNVMELYLSDEHLVFEAA